MSHLSPPIQAVLELFRGPLAELRFADVDAAVLSDLAGVVETAAAAVTEQEAQLRELRQTLADRQDALLLLAQRAVAYARVYAEHDEALTEQLAAITLPRAGKPRKVSARPAAGAEPSAAASALSNPSNPSNPSVTDELTIAEGASVLAYEEASEPNTDAFDAPSPDAPSPRKGKRRSSATNSEATG